MVAGIRGLPVRYSGTGSGFVDDVAAELTPGLEGKRMLSRRPPGGYQIVAILDRGRKVMEQPAARGLGLCCWTDNAVGFSFLSPHDRW